MSIFSGTQAIEILKHFMAHLEVVLVHFQLLPLTIDLENFLRKWTKNLQIINKAEHTLKIPGNSIVSSKKKWKNFARDANEPNESSHVEDDRRAMTYEAFVKKLIDACNQSDDDSQKIIEKLVPGMVDLLIKKMKING